MIHPIVPITPTQSSFESHEIAVIRRYSRNAVNRQTPIASKVAGIATQVTCSGPSKGRFRAQVREAQTRSSPGQKKAAYCESPTAPDAIESGALNESCQIKRKETARPNFCGP